MPRKNDGVPERPIVAELGRPETPEETANRKAERSRLHRSNQTALNLVAALIVCLVVVLLIVLVVVRPDPAEEPHGRGQDERGEQQVVDEVVRGAAVQLALELRVARLHACCLEPQPQAGERRPELM